MSNRVPEKCFYPSESIQKLFESRGMTAFDFQQKAWRLYLQQTDIVIHVPTGMGKTFAACLGPIAELRPNKTSIGLLYISPMRALIQDIAVNLQAAMKDMQSDLSIGVRTGDTSSYQRAKQKKAWPDIFLTTPESLAVLLTGESFRKAVAECKAVVIDELHELIGNKRGVHLQLLLSDLGGIAPRARRIGLSATLAKTRQGAKFIRGADEGAVKLVQAKHRRMPIVKTIYPKKLDSFPWSGHLGLGIVEKVVETLNWDQTQLFFCNTRFQAERWYQAFLEYLPEKSSVIGIHHSSIDKEVRIECERALKCGEMKLVVCTSSLDLGVDFPAVDSVYQCGSPKGVARFLQRAGRSRHRPMERALLYFVPTNTLQLFEIAALRQALEGAKIESLEMPSMSLDVLAQHLLSRCFNRKESKENLFNEVRRTHSFRHMSQDVFEELIGFLSGKGGALKSYSQYCKLELDGEGNCEFRQKKFQRDHLFNVGTITSSASVRVQFYRGAKLGEVEERFISKLKKGDVFRFAGRNLRLEMMKHNTAYVKLSKSKSASPPAWAGGNLALSSLLADEMLLLFKRVQLGETSFEEVQALRPLIKVQLEHSRFPVPGELICEQVETQEGRHLFVYTMAGRSVNEAIAPLLGLRLGRLKPSSFQFSVNDYGIELLSYSDYPFQELMTPNLFSVENLEQDINDCINVAELGKRVFRDIAQIAGLVQRQTIHQRRGMRQLQISSSLLFDVFKKYEPSNFLFQQAYRELLESIFERKRLETRLRVLQDSYLQLFACSRPTPLAFPLLMDRLSSQLSTETLQQRLEKMMSKWTRSEKSPERPPERPKEKLRKA